MKKKPKGTFIMSICLLIELAISKYQIQVVNKKEHIAE